MPSIHSEVWENVSNSLGLFSSCGTQGTGCSATAFSLNAFHGKPAHESEQSAQCSRAQDFHPAGGDTYWPKAPSTFALVAPQVEEAVVIYLEDADNQYSFEVVCK